MFMRTGILSLLLVLLIIPGCKFYTFKGYDIPDEAKTYYVGTFKVLALNAPPVINQTFTEALKDKISRESRLIYGDVDPDFEFNGSIQAYDISIVAPQPGETITSNRLTIRVSIEYTNHLEPKKSWTKTFSFSDDFSPNDNLLEVQDELIQTIFRQILEDVFNAAFTNW